MEEKLNIEPKKDNTKDNKKANKLCVVALILYVITIINFFKNEIINRIVAVIQINELIRLLIFFIVGIAPLLSFIIIIYVRLKYPKNTFAKILFTIIVLSVIICIIVGIMIFYAMFKNWPSWLG